MSWPIIITLIVAAAVLEPIILVWALLHFGWGPLARSYPAQPADDDAVTRSFQSFRLGLINLGFCIHVTVDERHLHLRPAAVLRWFGARAASIPWGSIRIVKRSRPRPGGPLRMAPSITARIDGRTLAGPAWCLELAESAPEPQGGPKPANKDD